MRARTSIYEKLFVANILTPNACLRSLIEIWFRFTNLCHKLLTSNHEKTQNIILNRDARTTLTMGSQQIQKIDEHPIPNLLGVLPGAALIPQEAPKVPTWFSTMPKLLHTACQMTCFRFTQWPTRGRRQRKTPLRSTRHLTRTCKMIRIMIFIFKMFHNKLSK